MKAFFVFIFFLLFFSCCLGQKPVSLDGVEVRDYQGERLSSINDFWENSIKGPQFVNIADYRLRVSGLVDDPKQYTYQEAKYFQPYTKVVTLYCVEGWNVKILWQGILLDDIINESKPRPDANTVIFHSVDGYTTSLPLSYIRNRRILLAYMMNNVTIPPERGFPFHVVAEDKWGYKWAKWVTEIEISNNPDYKGYWEKMGFSNQGDYGKPYLG